RACRLDHLAERRPGKIRHGEVEQILLAPRGEDWHDVRVVQLGQGPPLAVEPEQQARAGRLAPADRLDRHAAPQWLFNRLVHLPHASPADGTDDPVWAEP